MATQEQVSFRITRAAWLVAEKPFNSDQFMALLMTALDYF
jgi:hypothetical protein